MIANLLKAKGSHDQGYLSMNNTTNAERQRFGQNKFMLHLEDTFTEFLKDCKFVEGAINNPCNLPKDVPALVRLVNNLENKYSHITSEPFGMMLQISINAIRQELANMSIKFYKFYFNEKEKPITIEAVSKASAYHHLEQIMPNVAEQGYELQHLVDVKVENPIVGVSRKKNQGKNFIWTTEGWIEERLES